VPLFNAIFRCVGQRPSYVLVRLGFAFHGINVARFNSSISIVTQIFVHWVPIYVTLSVLSVSSDLLAQVIVLREAILIN